jgi:hypothetical protein
MFLDYHGEGPSAFWLIHFDCFPLKLVVGQGLMLTLAGAGIGVEEHLRLRTDGQTCCMRLQPQIP